MNDKGIKVICLVIGFKFLTGKQKFKGISCPIHKENGKGVAVQVFKFVEIGGVLKIQKEQALFINIDKYESHVQVKRENKTNFYKLIEK